MQRYSDANLVAKSLGLSGWQVISDIDLVQKVRKGLPTSSLTSMRRTYALDQDFINRIIPRPTLARRARARSLSQTQSDKVLAISKVLLRLVYIYDSTQLAARFLGQPHPLLDNRKPIDLMTETIAGADLVLDLLEQAEAGNVV